LLAYEVTHRRHDGGAFQKPFENASLDGLTLECRMISELLSDDRLPSSETELRAMFEQSALGLARVRFTDTRWIDVNDALCKMLGRSREEMLAMSWLDTTHPDDIDLDLVPFRRMASGELNSYSIEKRFLHAEGHSVWAKLTLSLIRDADSNPAYELAIIEDISAQKLAEEALGASEAKYRELFNNMVEEVHSWELVRDEHGRIATWRLKDANPPALKTWGWALEDIRGKAADEIFGPGATAHYLPIVEKVMREGVPHAYEDYLPNLERHFRFTTVPLDEAFITTGTDITAMKRTIAQNEQLVAQLRETDKRKDDFLAMLAHELRNPLAPISAAANLMEIAELDAARIKQTSQVISRQVRHMTGLVDDLLDVSRVTRGLVKLAKTDLDVKHVIADAIEQVRPVVEGKRHRLTLELDPVPAHVLGDQKRLVQIITNLLNNAAKYTPEGGSLHLSMLAPDGHVILKIADNGVGISPELQPHIFDLFTQGERSSDRSQGGLGIGLSLVKSLVELHGGTVAVQSGGPGHGSEFSVTLPRILKQDDTALKLREMGQAIATGKTKRILVVDDNVDAAQMLAMYLEVAKHQVFVEHSSKRALERVKMLLPEVCVLDIGMPEMDGYELARSLKADPETAQIVLIALTGYAQEQDRQTAMSAGFEHHLAKPVDPAKLLALLS
jgi:PAS domain S-box-containing protein